MSKKEIIFLCLFLMTIVSSYAQTKKEIRYDNGNIKQEYFIDKTGQKTGEVTNYYPHPPGGKIKSSYCLNENGNKNGKEIIYNLNGSIKKIALWDNGKLRDSILRYTNKGKLYSIGYIKKGTLSFFSVKHDIKTFEVPLKNGKKDGIGTYYNLDGSIHGYQGFKQGKKDGYFFTLNKKNRPSYIANFDKGEFKGLLITFYENGYIKSLSTSKISGNGISIDFYNNGSIKLMGEILNGHLNGIVRKYSKKGNLVKKIRYKKGNIIKTVHLNKNNK